MGWAKVFSWGRNIFAVVGVLGCMAVVTLVAIAVDQERKYEQREQQAMERSATPTAEDARGLAFQALIKPESEMRLLAGVRPDWSADKPVEAYCVESNAAPMAPDWAGTLASNAFFRANVANALAMAHARLACIPTSDEMSARGLQLRIISAEFDNEGIDSIRLALRDPAANSYFLVSINHNDY